MKNLFILFFAAFFISLDSAVPSGVQQLLRSREIRCEGNWSGHLQGFAFDGKDKLYTGLKLAGLVFILVGMICIALPFETSFYRG